MSACLLSVCLSFCLRGPLSFCPFVCLFASPSVCLTSVRPCVFQPISLSLSVCPPARLSLWVYLYDLHSVRLFAHPSARPSIRPSVHLYIIENAPYKHLLYLRVMNQVSLGLSVHQLMLFSQNSFLHVGFVPSSKKTSLTNRAHQTDCLQHIRGFNCLQHTTIIPFHLQTDSLISHFTKYLWKNNMGIYEVIASQKGHLDHAVTEEHLPELLPHCERPTIRDNTKIKQHVVYKSLLC